MNKLKILKIIRLILIIIIVGFSLYALIQSAMCYGFHMNRDLTPISIVVWCLLGSQPVLYLFDYGYLTYSRAKKRYIYLPRCVFFLALILITILVPYFVIKRYNDDLFLVFTIISSFFPLLYFFFDWLILKPTHTKLLTAEELEIKAKEKEPEKLKKKRLKKIKRIKKRALRKATDFKIPTPTSLASIKNWFVPKIATEEIVDEALKQLVDEDMITILDDNHYQATELAYKYKAKKTYGWLLTIGICCIIVGTSNFSRFKEMVNVVVGILFIVIGITIMIVAFIMRPKD